MSNPHVSVSSSVYSEIEADYKTKRSTNHFPSIEEDEQESLDSDFEGSDTNSIRKSLDRMHFPQTKSAQTIFSQQSQESHARSNHLYSDISTNSTSSYHEPYRRIDNDETPRLNEHGQFLDHDKTPKMKDWRAHTKSPKVLVPDASTEVQKLPPNFTDSTLAMKFQRLSSTLQQNDSKVSQESQKFQVSFSLNVERAKSLNPGTSRTSQYYKKVHSNPKDEPSDRQQQSSYNGSASTNSQQNSYSNDNNASMGSQHDFASGGLNISFSQDRELTSDNYSYVPTENLSSEQDRRYSDPDPEADMSVLFIRALHSFDATESQTESMNSVCLSFEKGDLAFVHTIDDSGWGEVTLLETLDRGWIPMNFFSMAVNSAANVDTEDGESALQYAHYMWKLLNSCGKFLMNPISHITKHGVKTFSIRIVNEIRDGVRSLLQETDCLSRSNEIVIKRPIVRKCRKTLLSDWYNLMLKANDFRGTSNYDKIEILTLLIFQVIRRAAAFFRVWLSESSDIIKRESEKSLQTDLSQYPLLSSPPMARQRVTEINGILYSYLGLIIGRLDIIEHNPAGCDVLESVVHHIILLLREFFFISKTGSNYSMTKPAELDNSLDSLLSLVSEIVTGVKSLVILTMNEHKRNANPELGNHNDDQYLYTVEGKRLIYIAAKMVTTIQVTISCIKKMFESIGDYKLSSERSYPDYLQMRIDPDIFINKCTMGLAKSHSVKNRDLRSMKLKIPANSNRYSMIRSGNKGNLGITANGVNVLHKILLVESDDNTPFGSDLQEFQKYKPSSDTDSRKDSSAIKDELLVDANGNLLGASLKGLVFTLTDEISPPEYFFVSTFFISFRSFANGLDLMEKLISRFESVAADDNRNDMLQEVRAKNRRKLICKVFQIWLESYWDSESDSVYLATLINFFNECVFKFLPIEAMKLIEIAVCLIEQEEKPSKQLVHRHITLAKMERKNAITKGSNNDALTSRYSMIDGYELSRINTNSSVASSLKSLTLPMPLGISGQTSSSSSLLTKSQLGNIEALVIAHRRILGEQWCPIDLINSRDFRALDVDPLLQRWATLCQGEWNITNHQTRLVDFNGLEVAKQLTLIESEIFCSIGVDELVNNHYMSEKAHLKRAENVRISVLFTNSLSGYVLESILQPDISFQKRTNILKTWLKVAISCLYLRNFNSLAAIITSLQSHLVTRVSRIWEDLSEKYQDLYDYLCSIIHPERNYSVYRTKLKSFLLANDYNIPVVPYFSLFLQDLTFVSEGNPNYRKANTFLNQKLINIDKYLKLTRVLADIESLQIPYLREPAEKTRKFSISGPKRSSDSMDDYTIAAVPALKELILLELWKLSQVNKKDDDRAWKLSCVIQPRESSSSSHLID